jgi:hypothetical protein
VRKYTSAVPILGAARRPRPSATEEVLIVPQRVAARLTAVLAALVALAGCGGTTQQDPKALLLQAKKAIDATPSLHFVLTSSGASGSGTLITGGQGDAKRPDGFRGTLNVMQSGFSVTVHIVSSGGTFYAQLPFSSRYEPTDPAKYGFGDPSTLLDPDKGLSSLLTNARSESMADRDRYNGEELDEVDVTLPGDLVAALLTSADKSKPVKGRVGIDTGNHEVRRVVLTGPFFAAAKDSTFTLVLDNYGENVTITPPAG